MSLPLPRPIVFDVSARDNATIRAEYLSQEGGGKFNVAAALLLTSSAVQAIGPCFRLYRRHESDPGDLVLLALSITLAAFWVAFFFAKSRSLRVFARAQVETIVSFETYGLSIERTNSSGGRESRIVPFDLIRSVRRMPHAIVLTCEWQALLILPTSALASGTAEYMSFFDEHLTGKAMLVRPSGSRATIVNTASVER